VIAIDTNILVYSHRADAPSHDAALALVQAAVEGDRAWAIPWPCIHEFLTKVTHPRIFREPTPIAVALAQVAEWRRSPSHRMLAEPEDYFETLARTLEASQVVGAKVHDACIAALCEAHGVEELWSADRDFQRFGRLRVRNPLVSA
jgi:toxin-antitoxin system PIN domain toxin